MSGYECKLAGTLEIKPCKSSVSLVLSRIRLLFFPHDQLLAMFMQHRGVRAACCYSQLARLFMADRTQCGRSSREMIHGLHWLLVAVH